MVGQFFGGWGLQDTMPPPCLTWQHKAQGSRVFSRPPTRAKLSVTTMPHTARCQGRVSHLVADHSAATQRCEVAGGCERHSCRGRRRAAGDGQAMQHSWITLGGMDAFKKPRTSRPTHPPTPIVAQPIGRCAAPPPSACDQRTGQRDTSGRAGCQPVTDGTVAPARSAEITTRSTAKQAWGGRRGGRQGTSRQIACG